MLQYGLSNMLSSGQEYCDSKTKEIYNKLDLQKLNKFVKILTNNCT